MKNRIKSILLSGLLLLILAANMTPVSAADNSYRLILDCSVEEGEQDIPVKGDSFAVVKIADVSFVKSEGGIDPEYSTVPRFADFDRPWIELTSSDMRDAAVKIAKAVTEQDHLDRQTTDSNGRAIFRLDDAGMYLVVRTKAADEELIFEPFLVCVPQIVDGSLQAEVVSELKYANRHIAPVVDPDHPGNDRLPQTGQIFIPIVIFASLGILMILLGLWMMHSGKKHEKDRFRD